MQARLKASRPGGKKEFLRELLRQVKIDGSPVTVTSNSPRDQRSGSLQCSIWWRRGESNPRPRVFHLRDYMLSRCFDVTLRAPNGWVSQSHPV